MSLFHEIVHAFYQAVMFVGGCLCHQHPERSPHIAGLQLPLCWRCTGIMVGVAVFACWLITRKQLLPFALSCALATLMLVDVLTAMSGLWSGDNVVRFLTGGLWGIFGTSAVLHLMRHVDSGAVAIPVVNKFRSDNGRSLKIQRP
jgi:uncharacterized membrane protein